MSYYQDDCTCDCSTMTGRWFRHCLYTLHILVIVNIFFFIFVYHRLISHESKSKKDNVESSSCTIPQFKPWDPTIGKLIHIPPVYRCPTDKKQLIDVINYTQLKINQTVNQTLYKGKITHCVYYAIGRNPDEKYFRDYTYTLSKQPILIQNGITDEIQDADYVLTRCYDNPTILFDGNIFCGQNCTKDRQSTTIRTISTTTMKGRKPVIQSDKPVQEYVHTLMRLKKRPFSYEEWIRPTTQTWWENPIQTKIMPPSILFIILDAVSDLQARRALPQTLAYLEKKGLYSFNRHSVVGDGTFDNIVPLFFGKYAKDLLIPNVNDSRYTFEIQETKGQGKKKVTIKKTVHYPGPYDNHSFIIKNFSKKFNYTTFFSEEWKESAFYNLKNGFHEQPTDYYLRPFWLSIYDSLSYNKFWGNSNPKPCYLNNLLHRLSLDWLKQFLEVHSSTDQPKFGILKLNEMSHDYMERLFWIDSDLKTYFENFFDKGLLSNTIFILCGDHGHRQHPVRLTQMGSFEAKLPFFSMLLPDWFKQKFPKAIENLINNRKVLTSWWDVYETLVNILNMIEKPSIFHPLEVEWKSTTSGISLFHPIPNRDCTTAGIPEKFCPCSRSNPIDIETPIVKQVALYSVSYINDQKLKNHKHLCMKLELKSIIRADVEILPKIKHYRNNVTLGNFTHLYTVLFETQPSMAIFESNLLYDPLNKFIQLHSDMSRINLYRKSSACIQDRYELKSYCYCLAYHQSLNKTLSTITTKQLITRKPLNKITEVKNILQDKIKHLL